MVSLTTVYEGKVPRPITLKSMVEFNSIEHMRETLYRTLSITEDFTGVPKVRAECRILKFGPKDHKQYKICPEQDCEQLVFNFDPSKSMIANPRTS